MSARHLHGLDDVFRRDDVDLPALLELQSIHSLLVATLVLFVHILVISLRDKLFLY